MSDHLFEAGGSLMADSPVYVLRDADEKAATHLRRMEYITLVEPRQQGKTSLINKLIGQFSTQGFTFAVRDLMVPRSSASSCADWYTSVGSWLSRQFTFIPKAQRPTPPVSASSWETFLAAVAEMAEVSGLNVVIVLDEIGAIPIPWATDFFSVIRSVYTTRQSCSFWKHLTFILAGAFNPKELIKDKTISDFNVDKRIVLQDFDLNQVQNLVDHLNLPTARAEIVAQRIHHWTDGQPYLSQLLCSYLAADKDSMDVAGIETAVDEAIERFFREDKNYLQRIKELVAESKLLAYTVQITGASGVRFCASLNERHFRLAHILGVIKADREGCCRVRNRVCERAIRESEKFCASERSQPTGIIEVFFSYSHKDEELRDQLEKHLSVLKHNKVITGWHDRRIGAGTEWAGQIDMHLNSARVILLLISADFLASQYCYDIELKRAMQRHGTGEAYVLPIILRPVDWHGAIFGELQALPKDAKPVTLLGKPRTGLYGCSQGNPGGGRQNRREATGDKEAKTSIGPLPASAQLLILNSEVKLVFGQVRKPVNLKRADTS